MGFVLVDSLEEGMVLAEDLFNEKGQFILAKGAILDSRHIDALKRFGVLEADIVGTSQSELDGGELDPSLMESARAYQRERFRLCDLEHEGIKAVFELAVEKTARHLQAGWQPPEAVAEVEVPAGLDWSAKPSSESLVRGKVRMAALPDVYSKIVAAINTPNCAVEHLAEIVSKDSSISVRLLKLVNSAYYALPKKINSISRAITLLGTRELLSLALGITIVRKFSNLNDELVSMEVFWKHAIRTGLFAQQIARRKGLKETESFFVGGLLHDIGRLVMLVEMPEYYASALNDYYRNGEIALYQAERQTLGYDHAQVGRLLCERWHLPFNLAQMVGWHHKPQGSRFALESCIIHLADFMAQAMGLEMPLPGRLPPLHPRAWEVVAPDLAMLAVSTQHVEHSFREIAGNFLGEEPRPAI
ncbi:HD-like signal output (HDOD) protein [Geothermobacter ehrlichii]|uniref:HD-like signal output (HDOD) protein n=1 Tax=Geothermobacter ehrlichii TaxID=213224 RepID=A0A5D3WJX2_9BACT|nr:HDOD domain-containing protein [Geothermobacter ehrlichii]TYO99262.1 HD-like signal output (HDOD) protein [Geothermobacter ehrlichii]